MTPKTVKPIRQEICSLGQSLDRMATMADDLAKSAALAFLRGDAAAEKEAWKHLSKADAYRLAMEKVDDLRRELDAGNIG